MRIFFVTIVPIAMMVLAALLGVGLSCAASFHKGGAGNCAGCHTMHNSENDMTANAGAGASLLRASDSSSICLNCHAGAGGPNIPSVFSFDGSAMTPGGDFYWITKGFTWMDGTSPAARHGHNVVASDFNLLADPNRLRAPGGNYPSDSLSCISCHDPHGESEQGTAGSGLPVSGSGSYGEVAAAGTILGNYRLLGDSNYSVDGFSFPADAPIARQNKHLPFAESDSSHVDYGSGMSEWCGNCHAGVLSRNHEVGNGSFEHPAGNQEKLEADIISQYNAYIRTGDLTGVAATAYLQFVPFERGVNDSQMLDPTSTQGPDVSSNVMCLTCHRAHASAFPYAGRWDFTANLLVDSHPAVGDAGASATDVLNSYYGRSISFEFGPDQGSFCEKCHVGGTSP